MLNCFLGENLYIPLQLDGGEINQFPRVLIYNVSGTLLGTFDMTHVATGLYKYIWVTPVLGQYILIFKIYTDAGHTTLSVDYGIIQEDCRVWPDVNAIKERTDNLPDDPTSETIATVNKNEILAEFIEVEEEEDILAEPH